MDAFQLIRLKQPHEMLHAVLHGIADVNVTDRSGRNLLQEAIAYGNLEAAGQLICLGINVNHKDPVGQSPLHFAALYKTLELAKAIIDVGGDLSIRDAFGNTPLWTAVFNARGHYSLVSFFIQKGADPTVKNEAGRSPLDFARQIKEQELIDLLTHPNSDKS